ncbi:MAG: hypothetical protein GQ564_03255 [Bacteroidales bacterium]|nr:hypothetical protein [Bacteroidales bacterium]
MVRGLDKLKEYFKDYADNYIIIGGTACDIIIDDAGFTPRATKDIDIILVVEVLSADFVKQFWQFINDGNYERKEKSEEERKYYRFIKPENTDFPYQVELFARNPDLLDLDEDTHLTPIPVDDDLSSLSAILLDETYYHYLIENSTVEDDVQRANTEALICLKAKAYLDINARMIAGGKEDSKNLRKHKGDVFRLGVMLADVDAFELPNIIKNDMQKFVNAVKEDLPDKQIFKTMGLGNVNVDNVYEQLIKSFGLDGK